jgi:subtilisin family serine protease
MRRTVLLLVVVGAMLIAFGGVLAQATPMPASLQTIGDAAATDSYIVVLKDDAGQNPEQVANEHALRLGIQVRHVYHHALEGYAAVIPNAALAAVQADERVAYVEPDIEMNAVVQYLPWGVDMIGADSSSTKAGNGSGTVPNVNTYIIDTGIDASQTDLNVVKNVNFVGGPNTDCNGHGTHVAGTVAARDNRTIVVGTAPGAPLTGVKVLPCNGSGWTSDVIEGVDWVTANAKKPAIANMSLSGGTSYSLDRAVQTSAESGIFYAVAAGNEGADACNSSPARAGVGTDNGGLSVLAGNTDDADNGILTVAATDTKNREISWSNYGECVEIWAPGGGILSTRLGGGMTKMSGTSMAAPHVGGGAALYLSSHPGAGSPAVEGALKEAATKPGTRSKDGHAVLLENVGGF